MPLAPDSSLGPYRVIGLLGEGGMGAVYRAKDTRLGRDVAIKVLSNVTLSDRERLQRFEQEARATGMLNHPNLLTIYDIGRDDEGNPFLVSELLEGETLGSRLTRGPLAARRAVDAALQMAHGLAAAHEKGIVHRDLKPDNIFLTRDGRLKILDFGIAKLTGGGAEGPVFESAATEPGMVLGTVGYMSPEQVRGEPVDHRSDIFSLGTIVYEMLTGTRAFKRNSSIETLSAILREDPADLTELLPNIPPALERLVRRCLEKDRELRFQTARDLAFNLDTLSTMSTQQTLSNAARPATMTGTAAAAPSRAQSTSTSSTTAAAPLTARSAAPTVKQTAVRPVAKPKRRTSPLLLFLLYLVSIAGAAYAGWLLSTKQRDAAVEPQFDRMTFRRGYVRAARFAPDGETIVYSAAWDGRPPEIFVATRRATEARPLGIPSSDVLAVSKSTELAILLNRDRVTGLGTLARVPLAGGIPREVAEHVRTADWSPDGANLAIIRENEKQTRVEYPIGTVKYETQRAVSYVRVSPDGKRLLIVERVSGEYDLALIDNGKPEAIARGWPRGVNGVAWSGDGKEIWLSGASNAGPPAIYAVDVATGAVRLVSRVAGWISILDLSHRGEALIANNSWRAALVWKAGGDGDPAAAAPAATTAALTTPATEPAETTLASSPRAEQDASWLDWSVVADISPDGKTILFSETREGGGENRAIYLRRAGSPAPVHLGEGIADALSPDGKWVLAHQREKLAIIPTGTGQPRELKLDGSFESGAAWFADSRRAVMVGAIGSGGRRLYVIDTLDETAKPISPENIWSGGTRAFAVSPDNMRVAGMTADRTIGLYPLDGSAATPLAGAQPNEIPIEWSADGAWLFVHDPNSLPARVHRINVTDGTRELWNEFSPADPAGVYRIAPVLITRDGNAYAYNALRTLSDLYVAEGLK
ncbi:MAG TPA: protein kinase [Thermoanaerobaculia bacterium]|jgi:serine/threonine protein kinase